MSEDNLLIVPVPALVAVLLAAEREKGAPLTEEEVLTMRDNAASIAMDRSAYEAISERRGYDDIDPENAWADWQVIRTMLDENK